jgi:hypothetical protein
MAGQQRTQERHNKPLSPNSPRAHEDTRRHRRRPRTRMKRQTRTRQALRDTRTGDAVARGEGRRNTRGHDAAAPLQAPPPPPRTSLLSTPDGGPREACRTGADDAQTLLGRARRSSERHVYVRMPTSSEEETRDSRRKARGGRIRRAGSATRRVVTPLEETCFQAEPGSAICVQRFDDSLNSAIRTTYRISLRSSSLREPRYPSAGVV